MRYLKCLTLLHSERPKLHTVLTYLSAIGLSIGTPKTINFSFVLNGKLMVSGVPVYKNHCSSVMPKSDIEVLN